MKKDACTEERFLKDVAAHEMTILREDGVHRHVRFGKPGTVCYQFDLITWPGYLCFCGDMGTYVFRRLEDMFAFFRTDRRPGAEGLQINPSYWGEKVEAEDRHNKVTAYSPDRFREAVLERLAEDWRGEEASEELRAAVEEDVLRCGDEERAARDAVDSFRFEGKPIFRDFWECDLSEYTFRFLWCCYALAWGIAKYDAAQLVEVQP